MIEEHGSSFWIGDVGIEGIKFKVLLLIIQNIASNAQLKPEQNERQKGPSFLHKHTKTSNIKNIFISKLDIWTL